MKNLLKYSLFALLLAAMLLALAACGDHTHEYAEEWVKDATHHWHNPICDHKPTDRVPVGQLASHTYDSPILTAATCTTAGKEISTCSICGYKKEVTVAATGHSYANNKQAYVAEGEVLYLCTYCDNCDVPLKTVVDDAIIVTPDTAQTALDNAEDGAILYFAEGDYGTLLFRTLKEKSVMASSEWAGGSAKIYIRTFNNLTLIAAETATFDCIKAEAADHLLDTNIHSLYPNEYLRAGVVLNNLTIKGFTFTGAEAVAINLSGRVSFDGITVDGCKMTDADKDSRLLFRSGDASGVSDANGTPVLVGVMKNVTVKNCVVDGAYQVMELRGIENVTIVDNTFKNIAKQTLLLNKANGTFSGTITIKGNTAENIAERFIRMDGVADGATVIIENNAVNGYTGEDEDIIKVTNADGATVTLAVNTLPEGMTVTVPTPAE